MCSLSLPSCFSFLSFLGPCWSILFRLLSSFLKVNIFISSLPPSHILPPSHSICFPLPLHILSLPHHTLSLSLSLSPSLSLSLSLSLPLHILSLSPPFLPISPSLSLFLP